MKKGKIKQIYNDNKEDIILKRLNGTQIKDIAKEYNILPSTLSAYLSDDGIKWRTYSKEKDNEIIDKYNDGISAMQLGKEYHIDPNRVMSILRNNHIHIRTISENQRKYLLDENYFDKIDTPNKAYILGLLYADGNVYSQNNTNNINLTLQENDKDILLKIKEELHYEGPLYYINQSNMREKIKINRQNQWSLNISNKYMCNRLMQLGVVPCKSNKVIFPEWLQEELYSHFFRGLSDGDGCILKTEKRWLYSGTKELLNSMKEIIEFLLQIHCSFNKDKRKDFLYNLRVAGGIQVKKLLDWMYDSADLYLDRKYILYKEMYCN